MTPRLPFRVLLITPDLGAPELITRSRAALAAAPRTQVALQLRAKALETGALFELATALRKITADAGALFLVNGRLDVALAVAADGVQLPERGLEIDDARALLGDRKLIGASRHDLDGVSRAARAGASFVTLSPYALSAGKPPPLPASAFRQAAALQIPVIALGGIDASNASAALGTGASAVAVVSAVLGAPDPGRALTAILQALDTRGP